MIYRKPAFITQEPAMAMCWAHCRQTPGVLLCGRLPGIRERKVGEGKERKDFIDETLVKNAGGDMLQEQLAMMSYQKKKKKDHLQATDSWRP